CDGDDGAGPDGAFCLVGFCLLVGQGWREPRSSGDGRPPRPRRLRTARQLRLEFYGSGRGSVPCRLRKSPVSPEAGRESGLRPRLEYVRGGLDPPRDKKEK